jgi:hypothetical protein
METVKWVSLIIHIICGFSALAVGFFAIISKKGLKLHLTTGKLFFICMIGVTLSALIISMITENQFLFQVGIFSFYQNYFGFRSVKNKSLVFNPADWVIFLAGVINCAFMFATLNVVLVVFGLIQTSLVITHLRIYFQLKKGNELPKNTWLIQHLTLMLGTYIATLTAFLVVNINDFQPAWVLWIAPSVLGGTVIFYYTKKYSTKTLNPTKSLAVLILLAGLFQSKNASSQVYVEGGNTRHRFAQLNLGVDSRYFFSGESYSSKLNSDGNLETFKLGSHSDLRLIVGGTHFWGHADFYLAIPVANFDTSGFKTSVETGGKYFPWRIQHNKIRPYVGAAILPVNYTQGNGAYQVRSRLPITAGFVFNTKNHLFEFGMGYNYQNTGKYYINTKQQVNFKTQPFWISLGYKFMLETTLSAEKDWLSGRTQKLTDTLASLKKLNSITLAAGPSSAFFTRTSEYNLNANPFLDDHKGANIFGDFGIGYYLHKPDLQFNLAWRSYRSEISAYDYSQTASRKSLAFEALKFVSDYHGFAAFIGPVVSYEWLEVKEINPTGVEQKTSYQGIRPGITFGWDIRPNRLQQILLRTNLRYFPLMNLTMSDGKKFSFDQLEFNFIQVVIFPGRIF